MAQQTKLTYTVTSLDEAGESVKRIGELQNSIAIVKANADAKISEIKSSANAEVTALVEHIKLHTNALKSYSKANRKSVFSNAQSITLTHGCVGWRKKPTSIEVKKDTLGLIKKLFSPRRRKRFIIVTEEVNKTELAKLTDEQLAAINARRKTSRETFFVEPSHETKPSQGRINA